MSCPHSTRSDASPDRCSLCVGATAERIPFIDFEYALAIYRGTPRKEPPSMLGRNKR